MAFALIAFLIIFLLTASGGLLLFYRQAMLQRLPRVLSGQSGEGGATVRDAFKDSAASLGALIQPFERVLPKSSQEMSVVRKRLIRAGYRDETALKIFYGAKFLVPLFLGVLVTVTGVAHAHGLLSYLIALGLGYLLPDFWLGKRVKARQFRIRLGLPDVLDLMVICIEAGLSVDQATVRTADELAVSQPAISDELGLVILEQRAGRPRHEAWRSLAERTDLDVVRELVTVLIQADQFGTSVAKNLRVYSETLRTRRRQQIEEKAAKTAVKLVFPLVLCIFPSLFVVTLGPAILGMAETFNKFFNN
jgi:tight adherence protein C